MKSTIFVLALSICAIACGSSMVRHPDKTTKVSLEGKSLLIVAEDNATGNGAAEKAFIGAVGTKAGTIKAIPQVPAEARGIAKTYAEFGLNNEGEVNGADAKAQTLDAILQLASKIGTFDTIIFVGTERDNSGIPVPKLIKMHLYAAVYDIKSRRVLAAVKDDTKMVEESAVGQLPLSGRSIVGSLLEGEGAPNEEEKKK